MLLPDFLPNSTEDKLTLAKFYENVGCCWSAAACNNTGGFTGKPWFAKAEMTGRIIRVHYSGVISKETRSEISAFGVENNLKVIVKKWRRDTV